MANQEAKERVQSPGPFETFLRVLGKDKIVMGGAMTWTQWAWKVVDVNGLDRRIEPYLQNGPVIFLQPNEQMRTGLIATSRPGVMSVPEVFRGLKAPEFSGVDGEKITIKQMRLQAGKQTVDLGIKRDGLKHELQVDYPVDALGTRFNREIQEAENRKKAEEADRTEEFLAERDFLTFLG